MAVLCEWEGPLKSIVDQDGLSGLTDVMHMLTIDAALFAVRGCHLSHLLKNTHFFHVLTHIWSTLLVLFLAAHPDGDLHLSG